MRFKNQFIFLDQEQRKILYSMLCDNIFDRFHKVYHAHNPFEILIGNLLVCNLEVLQGNVDLEYDDAHHHDVLLLVPSVHLDQLVHLARLAGAVRLELGGFEVKQAKKNGYFKFIVIRDKFEM